MALFTVTIESSMNLNRQCTLAIKFEQKQILPFFGLYVAAWATLLINSFPAILMNDVVDGIFRDPIGSSNRLHRLAAVFLNDGGTETMNPES